MYTHFIKKNGYLGNPAIQGSGQFRFYAGIREDFEVFKGAGSRDNFFEGLCN